MKSTSAFSLILISAGLFYMFINPQYQEIKSLRAEASEYKAVLDDIMLLENRRDELLKKYQSMPKSEIERINKALPDHVDTVKLAMDFDAIAARYGISIKSIETSSESQNNNNQANIIQPFSGKPFDTVNVSFSFVSTYDNFRKFMNDIEKSLRIIDIDSMSFVTNETGLYDYHISIKTYWLK